MNNRCGSSWLVSMLRSAGLRAGELIPRLQPEVGWEAKLSGLEREFGVIVFKVNTAILRRALPFWGADTLRTWKWVRLVRRDRFAQAVSNYLAKHTDQWHRMDGGEPRQVAELDRDELLAVYRRTCRSEARMRPLLEQMGTLIPTVSYEYMCQQPELVGRAVYFHFMGHWPRELRVDDMHKVGDQILLEHWRSLFSPSELEEALCHEA